MIEQGLFKRHFVGRDGFIWWIGQIASEKSWKDNIPALPVGSNNDIQGFGERYRVRIMGYHTYDPERITDEELPWAYIMYPPTAGSGGRSSSQSSNLAQGTFVFGFFLDGEDAQTPIIMGVLGNNDYAAVSKNIPPVRFVPFSGYTENDYVAWYAQRTETGGEVVKQNGPQAAKGTAEVPGEKTGESNNQKITESANHDLTEAASEAAADEPTQPLAKPSRCEPVPVGKIQQQIKNVVVEIQKIQKSVYKYSSAVQNQIGDIQNFIDKQIRKATKFISESLKWIFVESQKYIINKVNNTLKDTYYLIFPNERPGLKRAIENINDLIACLFRKLIKNLFNLVLQFLTYSVSRVINAAQCFVENFIANILGQIIGLVTNIVNGALSVVNSLVGQISSITDSILGILIDLLSFLTCEEEPQCSKVNQWNILNGTSAFSISDFDSIITKAQNIAQTFTDAIDIDNFDFDLNFDDVFNQDSCNIGPLVCGPPVPQFFGGNGIGAAGNLIISAAGEVIGIDMISFGVGYDRENTFANVYDNCGKGRGAVILPVIEDYTDDDGNTQTGVVDIIVIEPGTGYLAAPDGSKGGNGYTWADPGDTIVKHSDGSYDVPKPPGNLISVIPGDEVTIPVGTTVTTEPNNDQGGGEVIVGGNPYTITSPGLFTSPLPSYVNPDNTRVDYPKGEYPTDGLGSYPVILYLCDIIIQESGINYSPGDEVVITPDIGAVVEPKFDSQGRVISVKVTESGEGFTEYPQIYIQSETGYNAVLRPKLCIDRIGVDQLKEPTFQDQIVTVIDCVGKF